jgi:N-acetylglucosamine kinase-like BadF-type ATPase
VSDAVAAWAAASGIAAGVAAVAHVGSAAFGMGPDASTWHVGGWGPVLDDEGSGFWLGDAAIRAVLHDRDGSGPETALSDVVPQFFSLPDIEAVAYSVYKKSLTNVDIARLSTEVGRLAMDGDAAARRICMRPPPIL